MADHLADSIGINTHVSDYYRKSDYSTLVARAKSLGIRHFRDGILDHDASYNKAIVTLIEATHAKLDGITDCPGIQYYSGSATSAKDIEQFDAAIGNDLESVEGPNEVDARNDSNWVADTRNCLPSLRSAEPTLPFIAPSISNQSTNSLKLGDVSSYVDYGNGHRYFSGRNPATSGWGGATSCGTYGGMVFSLCETRLNSGSKPIMITESGYNSQTEVDELTQAKYLSRLPFVNLRAGITRSYVYDLKDYTQGDAFGHNGMLRDDDSEKPSFSALRNEIQFFSDAGAVSSTTPVPIAVIAASSVDHLLFVKSDGSYILAIWNEASSWNPLLHNETAVSSQFATITLSTVPTNVKAIAIDDAGALVSKTITTLHTTLGLPIDDHMTFISFRLVGSPS